MNQIGPMFGLLFLFVVIAASTYADTKFSALDENTQGLTDRLVRYEEDEPEFDPNVGMSLWSLDEATDDDNNLGENTSEEIDENLTTALEESVQSLTDGLVPFEKNALDFDSYGGVPLWSLETAADDDFNIEDSENYSTTLEEMDEDERRAAWAELYQILRRESDEDVSDPSINAAEFNYYFNDAEYNSSPSLEGIEVLGALKKANSIECYETATRQMLTVGTDEIADILTCQSLAPAYKDIHDLIDTAGDLVRVVVGDVQSLLNNIAECRKKNPFTKVFCFGKMSINTISKLFSQRSEVIQRVVTIENLGKDIFHKVKDCFTTPRHHELQNLFREAISKLDLCAQK